MECEQHAQGARDPHRVPVGQRERDPFGQIATPMGNVPGASRVTQSREGHGRERRRCPPEQHREVSDPDHGTPGQHENKRVQERSIEFCERPGGCIRPVTEASVTRSQ